MISAKTLLIAFIMFYAISLTTPFVFDNGTDPILHGNTGEMCHMGGTNPTQCHQGSTTWSTCCYCPGCGGAFTCVQAGGNVANNTQLWIVFNNKNQTIFCSSEYIKALTGFLALIAFYIF